MKIFRLSLLIVAGEAVFMLPFMIPRLYRPLLIEQWGLTNTQIGQAFAAYGITAMISYLIGGPLADRFRAHYLISLSLLFTGLVGVLLIINPSPISFIVLYGCFGVTSILLMWGALIKVTHITGGEARRALAMGVLDSGRGLTAAIMASALVLVHQVSNLRTLETVYFVVIGFNFVLALFIWFFLKNEKYVKGSHYQWSFQKVLLLLKTSQAWLLGLVVLSAYCGYKSIDNYSIFFVDVLGQESRAAIHFTSTIFWVRPLAALISGFLADKISLRIRNGRFLFLIFLLGVSSILQALIAFNLTTKEVVVLLMILTTAAFVYSLRAIYFSVFAELDFPDSLVGTVVGIVSFVGFLPDIFYGYITGILIDQNPGILGYKYSFLFNAAVLFIGAIASFRLYQNARFTNKRARLGH